MQNFFIIVLLVTSVVFTGCYYDSEEDLYPAEVCVTTNISYSKDIVPIITNSCISCHSALANLGGVNMEGHSEVLKYALDGSFLGSVKHLSEYSAMPQSAQKLNDCSISKIESWINAGSLNN